MCPGEQDFERLGRRDWLAWLVKEGLEREAVQHASKGEQRYFTSI